MVALNHYFLIMSSGPTTCTTRVASRGSGRGVYLTAWIHGNSTRYLLVTLVKLISIHRC